MEKIAVLLAGQPLVEPPVPIATRVAADAAVLGIGGADDSSEASDEEVGAHDDEDEEIAELEELARDMPEGGVVCGAAFSSDEEEAEDDE